MLLIEAYDTVYISNRSGQGARTQNVKGTRMRSRFIFGIAIIAVTVGLSWFIVRQIRSMADSMPVAVQPATSSQRPVQLKELFDKAQSGNAEAQHELSKLYLSGQQVPYNKKEGIHWLKLAAENGFPKAQFDYGGQLYTGYDVPQDREEAARWFEKAGSHDDPKIQLGIALVYIMGEKDYANARKWLEKSARLGNKAAQGGWQVPISPAWVWIRIMSKHATGFNVLRTKGMPRPSSSLPAWLPRGWAAIRI